jgi:hypothetical protein
MAEWAKRHLIGLYLVVATTVILTLAIAEAAGWTP